MYFQHIIKIIFCLVIVFSVSTVKAKKIELYKKEYNPYFKFKKFKRGEKSAILIKKLDKLETIDKTKWSYNDSLAFAEISLLTGNITLAKHYLIHLIHRTDSHKAVKLYLIAFYLEKDFSKAIEVLQNSTLKKESNQNDFLMKVLVANDSLKKNKSYVLKSVFHIQDSLIRYRKSDGNFKKKIIIPLKQAKEILEYFVMYIHDNDPVIARCFNEMGLILENNVSLNQAYIAYSIARTYNKHDREILKNVKRIKSKHLARNYNTPNFRKYFPKIEYWRFNYEILKEKTIFEKNDTLPKFKPNHFEESKNIKFPFPKDALIPIGIFLILLIILIFTRIRRR